MLLTFTYITIHTRTQYFAPRHTLNKVHGGLFIYYLFSVSVSLPANTEIRAADIFVCLFVQALRELEVHARHRGPVPRSAEGLQRAHPTAPAQAF